MSNRVYIGNLDRKTTEEDIRQLFQDRGLDIESILLKPGYAFVDCHDQTTVDAAIDKLAEVQLYDKTMHVEPALSKTRNGCKLVLKNIAEQITEEQLKAMLTEYGEVKEMSQQAGDVLVTFASSDHASLAKEKLNERELEGQHIKAEFYVRKSKPAPPNNIHRQEFPLRLLVPQQYVGAIIGKSGQTIRSITQKTNARVDVVRRDNTVAGEKMVVILASHTDSCIEACKEILQVINKEADETGQPKREPELRVLAHNNLCGRLIGKHGTIIKSIMSETSTMITVSSLGSISPMNQDRVVTIKGAVSDVLSAAVKIYNKLKGCYEADIQNFKYNPQHMYPPIMMPPVNPMWQVRGPAFLPHAASTMAAQGQFAPMAAMGGAAAAPFNPQPSSVGGHMTCYLYIPKASVGAVIGSKGSYINYVKQESRASCQVQERHDDPEASERPVKITGYPECVWKAQWFIFDKVKSEGFTGNEYARLRCDIVIPKSMVGRVIGKGGRNVRHIQDSSDAIVKLPEDQESDASEVAVQIIGNIYSQTLAQALIRQLLEQGQMLPFYADPAAPGAAAAVYGSHSATALMHRPALPAHRHMFHPAAHPRHHHPHHQQQHAVTAAASPEQQQQNNPPSSTEPAQVKDDDAQLAATSGDDDSGSHAAVKSE